MRTFPILTTLLTLALLPSQASAADFYIDPEQGSMSNDGSKAKPWKTLAEVINAKLIETQGWDSLPYDSTKKLVTKNSGAPVKAGDTLWLRSGYHGDVTITGHYNLTPITIAAEPGQQPKLSTFKIQGGSLWTVRGLSLSPSFAPAYDPKTMLDIVSGGYQGPTHDITVEDCFFESVPDTSAWTGDQWLTLPANGIAAEGDHHTIRNNHLHNVRFGISVEATNTLVERNEINSFGNGDGMRGLGDNSTFQYNVVKNAHHPDPDASKGNHDDGFQSWALGVDPSDGKTKPGFGVVKGITLRGNLFISHEEPDPPFVSEFQGIGCFDGFYEGFVIENNVIISSTYHGISLYGATNNRIVNNTVIYRDASKKAVPWIMIHDHKNGTPSTGNIVRNNLTTQLSLQSAGTVEDHNLLLKNPSAFFVDLAAFDLHLLPGAPAIDQGSSDLAPAFDADLIPRPQGAAVDVGAYEWHDGSVGSAGAGGSGTGGAGGSTAGQGGSVGSAGTAGAGAAGGPSGGAGGESGTSGQGGATGSAGTTGVAGQGGQGAAGAGTGGAGISGSSGQSADAPAGSAASEDDGGCGCRVVTGAPGANGAVGLLGVLLGGAALRRRRRR